MSRFVALVELLVAMGVVIAAVSNYLIINKLWKRRDKRDVAESVSIAAALLGLFTAIPLFIDLAFIHPAPLPALKTGIGMATGVVFVLIGSGMWVREYRERGFIRHLLRALNLERRECGYLLKDVVRPAGAEQIVDIMRAMALLDHLVDEREAELIREFAERWRIPLEELGDGARPEIGDAGGPDEADGRARDGLEVKGARSLLAVREGVERYLALAPPPAQAADLLDLLHLFARADASVTSEEEAVLDEVEGLVVTYLSRDGEAAEGPSFEVLIVPQSEAQFEAVRALLPGAEKSARGGNVFSVGRFFSPRYAEAVSERYVALGLFTAPIAGDHWRDAERSPGGARPRGAPGRVGR